eukprot:CAMPEP_0115881804 /NCGR_PEP_ID=MMETSP0287-20121206/28650_1 /TAXON_ID=412157 /ORGANISM="Chrysochromulina rotalis, Strain UIO044" /LENGTH=348 /DNA_ID=CAMNT_0003337807 /DNA_START=29 /DNA_END=1075 /DNA_ORIENTATION=-
MTTAQAVEKAIRLAQEAVKHDEGGELDEAIQLYTQSVDLIKLGLAMQREEEVVDNTVLHKYSQLYGDRITELRRSLESAMPDAPPAGAASSTTSGAVATGFFSFDEEDEAIKAASPPAPAPMGSEEWRRPFWLMHILRVSMQQGGYVSPDARVFVARRVWLQKGGRFAAMTAKLDCAQCLVTELNKVKSAVADFRLPTLVTKELDRLCETMDVLQTSLARVLPFVPEPKGASTDAANSSMGKLTERFKGLAKTLDKTAARLGAMPSKASDPSEYSSALIGVFEAFAFLEVWMEHYVKLGAEQGAVLERLHRCASFLYEVVCAFVIQDLDALIQRHMRKALSGFIKGVE